jgi:hypothetical protein
MNFRILSLPAFVMIALLAAASCARGADANGTGILGINLTGPADWNGEIPFVDAFRFSRRWISQKEGASWGKGPALDLDARGWVKRLEPNCYADTPVLTIDGGHYPAGRYTLLYDGKGKLEINGKPVKIISDEAGKMVFQVDPAGGGFFVRIGQTDPADYVRNIRLILPGFADSYASNPFHPTFLKRWAGIRCFRFMDWMQTNGSQVKHWEDRPHTDEANWQRAGVPLEVMLDLCNREKADAWLNIPEQADDDYVRHFAQQIKDQLDPSHKVYIEYSNEVWNGIFSSQHFAQAKGVEMKLSPRPWEAACLYYGRRSVEIFKIFADVFGDELPHRVVRVVSWQAASGPYWLDGMLLSHLPKGSVDALAIAPYLAFMPVGASDDPNAIKADTAADWTVDQLLDHVESTSLPESKRWMADASSAAKKYDLKLLAYEGGQHLVGVRGGENNQKLTALFAAANRSERMGTIYTEYLTAWQQAGGDLFCHFSSVSPWSKWGSWGLLEYYDEDEAQSPKFMAVMRWGGLR